LANFNEGPSELRLDVFHMVSDDLAEDVEHLEGSVPRGATDHTDGEHVVSHVLVSHGLACTSQFLSQFDVAAHQVSVVQPHHAGLARGVLQVEVVHVPELALPVRTQVLEGVVLGQLEVVVVN
jgi:hypothetical protein